MHIRVIRPVIDTTLTPAVTAEVEHWAAPGTRVDVVSLRSGTASIESEYDEALAGPGIVQRVEEAAVDGVFITCFADPGVHAAREIIDAPVVGGFEPSFLTAMSLGDRVGVVTILPNVVPMLRSLTRRYGLDSRLGSIRVVDMPVLGLTDREELIDRLAAQGSTAVENGEADSVVLGCTGILGVTKCGPRWTAWQRDSCSGCGSDGVGDHVVGELGPSGADAEPDDVHDPAGQGSKALSLIEN
ncbi:aspartate/glutamate racemase family protein [Rhodococcus sp. GB-02]